MRYEESAGLLTQHLDHAVMRWRTMRHHDRLGYWVPDDGNVIKDFQTWHTKRQAEKAAKAIGYRQDDVYKVGTNLCERWGIRLDFRTNYFLAK